MDDIGILGIVEIPSIYIIDILYAVIFYFQARLQIFKKSYPFTLIYFIQSPP